MVDRDAEKAQAVSPSGIDSADPKSIAGQCPADVARMKVVPHGVHEKHDIGEILSMRNLVGIFEDHRYGGRVREYAHPGGKWH